MYGKKMSKAYFFQTIEERLKELEMKVKEVKEDAELPTEQRIAKENIIFGRLLELYAINSAAMNIDYWRYSKLEERIRELQDKI